MDDEATPVPERLYLWRLLPLDPETAGLALRHYLRLRQLPVPSGPGPWVVPSELWWGRWWRVPVELELAPWCASRTTLALRPRLGSPRAPWPRAFYVRAAPSVLDRMQEELEVWARATRSVGFVSRCATCPAPGRCEPGIPVEPLETVGG